MPATSSHVTTTPDTLSISALPFADHEDESGNDLLPQLMQAAVTSKRAHILVSRRKRASRRAIR